MKAKDLKLGDISALANLVFYAEEGRREERRIKDEFENQ